VLAEALEPEELRTVVDESAGTMSEHSKEMLLGVLDLNKITVNDVMVPRNQIQGVDIDLPLEKILDQLSGFDQARVPVYRRNIDDVIGIIRQRDIVRLLNQRRLTKKALVRALKAPYFIPEGTRLAVQLHKFKSHSKKLALVVDEYGDIQGLVTMEDILEEIVGELDSDVAAITQAVKLEKDGYYTIEGSANIREINKYLNWHLPVTSAKTVSGLIVEKLQQVPKIKQHFKIDGYHFQAIATSRHKVVTVRVKKQSG